MGSSLRRSSVIVTTAALVAVLAVAVMPAQANHQPGAGVIIFRSVAAAVGLCYPGLHLVSGGACGATGLPVVGTEHSYTWTNNTFTADGAGLDFCVVVDSGATPPIGIKQQTSGPVGGTTCNLNSNGNGGGALRNNGGAIGPVHPGGYCGLSAGWGAGTVTTNTHSVTDGIQWVSSAATVLPIEDANLGNDVFTVGVVNAVGALGGGNCGVTAASQKFNVVGALAQVST